MCVSLSGRKREKGMGRDGEQKRKGGSELVWRSNGDLERKSGLTRETLSKLEKFGMKQMW